jgi:protein-disulfide isomerase
MWRTSWLLLGCTRGASCGLLDASFIPSGAGYEDAGARRVRFAALVNDSGEIIIMAERTHHTIPDHVPAHTTSERDAVLVGDGPVRIDAFIDFLCPYCKQFELSAEDALAKLVSDGHAALAYHPMNFLDEASTTNYSTRAAAASACAADQGYFMQYAHALFAAQPPEGGPGLSDTDLIELGREVGLDDASLSACVAAGRYLDWPPYVTARAIAAGVSATPTVLVAGEPVNPTGKAITAAVTHARGAT